MTIDYCDIVRSFVRSFFAGRGPSTLDPTSETFISVQCASPRRGGELTWRIKLTIIGWCVRCMCALCRVEVGTVGVSNLSGISKRALSRRGILSI